jgi:hypothetical protein
MGERTPGIEIADGAVRWATAAGFGAAILAATIGNWLRVQDVDPQFTTVLVQRTIKYGGSFYENGIHNRGPLEPFVYWLADRLTPASGYWYAISAFVVVIALVLAFTTARTAVATGAASAVAVAAGAAVFVHFALSDADYARVLYIRNLTTCLLAVAWVVTIDDRAWATSRRRTIGALVVGGALGLAVQSLISTVFTAGVVGVASLGFVRLRCADRDARRLMATTVVAAAVTFVSAPVWYLLRGSFHEYWSGAFTYAGYMSTGTGRSLGGQFALGWDQLYAYYQARPMAFSVIVAFVLVTGFGWRASDQRWRLLHAGLVAWFAAAWLELVVSQRYSSHYFSVSSVPTAFMAAALAGHVYRSLLRPYVRRAVVAFPLIALVVSLYLSGFDAFTSGLRDVSEFRGWNAHASEVAKASSGRDRMIRGVLGLVSRDGDPLLAWTQNPWTYLDSHRVAATRFIWKSFLMGEIYLGRTSPKYILPDTQKWFREDLTESRPNAYFEDAPGLAGSPYESYIRTQFTSVATVSDGVMLGFRRPLARAVLEPSTPTGWVDIGGRASSSGWSVAGGEASFRAGSIDASTDVLTVSRDSCFVLTGVAATSEGGPAALAFRFTDNAGRTERLRLALEGDRAASGSDFVEYLSEPTGTSGDGPTPFALLVGRRSAGLVVNGAIRAAVELPRSVSVTLESHSPVLTLSDLRVGRPPAQSGC